MKSCTEKELAQTLNKVDDGAFKYQVESWNRHQGKHASKNKSWPYEKRKGIRGVPYDWDFSWRGYYCMEIEKELVDRSLKKNEDNLILDDFIDPEPEVNIHLEDEASLPNVSEA